MKANFSDYTETEFAGLLQRIIGNDAGEEEENKLVQHFNAICGHPAGSDLIFYPEDFSEGSAESILQTVKVWRAAKGLPGFKDA